ncbi:MAG TPA: ferredoxin, partial [Planctomycetota bacterium]|nr:ferredoxin [Planctomycetota bacterium]
ERSGRRVDAGLFEGLGLNVTKKGLAVDVETGSTSVPGVFAAGECVSGADWTVRAVKSARLAARAVDLFLTGRPVAGETRPINVRMGRLDDAELAIVRETADASARTAMPAPDREVTEEQAVAESRRCVRCACLAKDDCRLRDLSTEYGARPAQFRGGVHRRFAVERSHPDVVYESNKCILCGLCIREAGEAHEKLGLAFHGRGFATTVAVPFERRLAEGLKVAAARCVEACPTGALAWKHGHAPSNER